jgi:hypothetical protein
VIAGDVLGQLRTGRRVDDRRAFRSADRSVRSRSHTRNLVDDARGVPVGGGTGGWRAIRLLAQHPLRAADALQLAAAQD